MSLSPENNDNDQKKEKKRNDWLRGLTERTINLFFQTVNRHDGYIVLKIQNLLYDLLFAAFSSLSFERNTTHNNKEQGEENYLVTVGGKIVYPNYLISTSEFYSTFFGTKYLEVEENLHRHLCR